MSIAHLLEDFGLRLGLSQASDVATVTPEINEAQRLDAYEDGYKAGWEDAIAANQTEKQQISADLAQNLRDISFTYQEACTQVTKSISGVFEGLAGSFLPPLARRALWPKVAEEIQKLRDDTGDVTFLIHVSPENEKVAASLGDMIPEITLSIREDPTLTAGQVVIGTETGEIAVDFDALLEEAQAALRAMTYSDENGGQNG